MPRRTLPTEGTGQGGGWVCWGLWGPRRLPRLWLSVAPRTTRLQARDGKRMGVIGGGWRGWGMSWCLDSACHQLRTGRGAG